MFKFYKSSKALERNIDEHISTLIDEEEIKKFEELKVGIQQALKQQINATIMLFIMTLAVILSVTNIFYLNSTVVFAVQHGVMLIPATYFFATNRAILNRFIYGSLIAISLIGLGINVSELIF